MTAEPGVLEGLGLLLRRRAWTLRNALRAFSAYEWARNLAFSAAGLGLLLGLYFGFVRLLTYLNGVEVIGPLLIWKLTAMTMLTTFSMVTLSGLLTSLTTLYYSFDLKFLLKAPLPLRAVFIDKSLESIFFASWMILLVMVPYVSALAQVKGFGLGFHAAFLLLAVPFLALAASVGISFTLILLYLFPSSRTRDAIWVLASLSLALVYSLIRFAEPERLIRPDALHVVADYLNFLQAPTAPYLPSWWITRALSAYAAGKTGIFWRQAFLLAGSAAAVYASIIALAGRLYFEGYSGAQEGRLRSIPVEVAPLPESRWADWTGRERAWAALAWKDRKSFFRDVKHWSQLLLIGGLIYVYLFSMSRLPLDNPDIRSMVSFLNIGVAGFVIASLGLRFTYPSISLEGRSWWVARAAPVELETVMRQKFFFSAVPMTAIAAILGLSTNFLLEADAFTSVVSLASLLVITWTLVAMGVGFGALFPMFRVENIHQIESSLGGFVYMASALGYIGAVVMILSWPVQMHFQERFGNPGAWNHKVVGLCAGMLIVLNFAALAIPWTLGRRALENHEG